MEIDIIGLLYCLIVNIVLFLALRDIFHTPVAQYSLFVLKEPLNNDQLTRTTQVSWYRNVSILNFIASKGDGGDW